MSAGAIAPVHHRIDRGFVSVEDRQFHYRIVGKGPPALFIHSSPTYSSFVLPAMLAQAEDYTCFASIPPVSPFPIRARLPR